MGGWGKKIGPRKRFEKLGFKYQSYLLLRMNIIDHEIFSETPHLHDDTREKSFSPTPKRIDLQSHTTGASVHTHSDDSASKRMI